MCCDASWLDYLVTGVSAMIWLTGLSRLAYNRSRRPR